MSSFSSTRDRGDNSGSDYDSDECDSGTLALPASAPTSALTHSYRVQLKEDGNRSHLHPHFHTHSHNRTRTPSHTHPHTHSLTHTHTHSHDEYRKKKYTIGSRSEKTMLHEDFEEILRHFEKKSSEEIYADCVHSLGDRDKLDNPLPHVRTHYNFNSLQRDFLIRFWMFQMGVEDHVVNAMLLQDVSQSVTGTEQRQVHNLTSLDAPGAVGLSRVDRFHRLLDEGVLGDRVAKHYIPKTKNGIVYWSENFTLAYSTVFSEPLRPVATTALSRLLTDRLYLLRLPRNGKLKLRDSGNQKGENGHGNDMPVLHGVLDQVLLSSPAPESASMTAIQKVSPNFIAPPTPTHSTILCDKDIDLSAEGNSNGSGDSTVSETDSGDRNHLSALSSSEVTLENHNTVEGTSAISTSNSLHDDDNSVVSSDAASDSDSSEHRSESSDEEDVAVKVEPTSEADLVHDMGGNTSSSSSSANVSNKEDSNQEEEQNSTSDSGDNKSCIVDDCYKDECALYTSAKMQALENSIGRRFEGIVDAVLEMLFRFGEPYADLVSLEEDKEDESDSDEEKKPIIGMYGMVRSAEEFHFRAYDLKQKGVTIRTGRKRALEAAEAAGKEEIKMVRKRRRDEEDISEASLNWEHVLECAQAAALDSFSKSKSHSVEIHPQLPLLELNPAMLRRVRSRVTAMFSQNTKNCAPTAKDKNNELLPQFPSSILK